MGQNELQTGLDQRGNVIGNRDFVFREHQDEDWEIETTYALFTTTPHSAWDSSIDEMLSHFLANTLTIGSVPFSVSNRRSRLEYARHHGVPTPVVDYSYSPYVALYFAFGGLQYRRGSVPKNASIYALDLSRLGIHWRRASARKEEFGVAYDAFMRERPQFFDHGFPAGTLKFVPVCASWNTRMLSQLGCFIMTLWTTAVSALAIKDLRAGSTALTSLFHPTELRSLA
ncbi:FRG domain-containing protein [Mesorhizobium sp. M1156]|uniref:FRG domain-containing protein n=1 Tax=Mesorhizobium sp. M1156 TaxID=2957064 RepID=UPI00333CA7A4